MANFNKSVNKGRQSKGFTPTKNHEGTTVHELNDLEALFSKVLGSFFGESTHYEGRESVNELKSLYDRVLSVPDTDKEYVLKIAEIGRMCNMISYPLNILSCVYNDPKYLGDKFLDDKGKNKIYSYADNIILRTKDITSIMATQFAMFDSRSGSCLDNVKGKSLPIQLKKNLKRKIESYDEFKLSKGLSKNNDVSLADCIKLLRPKPKTESYAKFYKDILDGTVKVGNDKAVIKSELVKKGQKKTKDNKKLSKAVYEDNLFNILKSLRTLLDNNVFDDMEVLGKVCARLTSPKEIKNSRILPFRFYSAYEALYRYGTDPARKLREAIEIALDLSVANMDKLEGRTCILIDVSYSMVHSISSKSSVKAVDIACLLGAIAYKSSDADLFAFSSEVARVDVSRNSTILDITKTIKKTVSCNGTELKTALDFIEDFAIKNKISYDNMLFLTDGDCYGYDRRTNILSLSNGWGYSGRTSPDAHLNSLIDKKLIKKLWINNLLGNDFSVCNTYGNKKNLLAGFSEKMFDIISTYTLLGGDKDIRKVIDEYYTKLKTK